MNTISTIVFCDNRELVGDFNSGVFSPLEKHQAADNILNLIFNNDDGIEFLSEIASEETVIEGESQYVDNISKDTQAKEIKKWNEDCNHTYRALQELTNTLYHRAKDVYNNCIETHNVDDNDVMKVTFANSTILIQVRSQN